MAERPNLNYDLSELERRLGLVANFATIEEVDYARPRVRVRMGNILTGWLVFGTPRAQNDRTWHPPEIGEQVFVVAPHGDLNQACVVCAVHSNDVEARQQPADRATVHRRIYADGTIEEYDREANQWLLDMTASGGTMEIKTGSTQVLIKPDHVRIRADRIDWEN